jgi:hypothetical protein
MNFQIHDLPQHIDGKANPEWLVLRSRHFTASTMGEWIAEEPENRLTIAEIKVELEARGIAYKKADPRPELLKLLPDADSWAGYTKGRDKARQAAIYEFLGRDSASDSAIEALWLEMKGWSGERETLETKRGNDLEPLARAAYEKASGHLVKEVGFVSREMLLGCSPDGLCISSALDSDGYTHGLELKCPMLRTFLKWFRDGRLPDEHVIQVHHCLAVTGLPKWDFCAWHPDLPSRPFIVTVWRNALTERVERGLLELEADTLAMRDWLDGLKGGREG